MKTSYDLRFRKLYPGTFVFNAAIRETFEERDNARIDFMTALDWHRRWAPLVQRRVGLLISASSVLTD